MGAKANFIFDMANENYPKEMSKDFKDALCLKGKYKDRNKYKKVEDAVHAFFDHYEPTHKWGVNKSDRDSIANSACEIVASMPTPRY